VRSNCAFNCERFFVKRSELLHKFKVRNVIRTASSYLKRSKGTQGDDKTTEHETETESIVAHFELRGSRLWVDVSNTARNQGAADACNVL